MPADVTQAKKFLLTSDYPLDKVIYLKSGSDTIPYPTGGYTIVIPHGLPFIPLVGGSWDITSTFDTNYNYSTGTIPSSSPGATPFNLSVFIKADATNITLTPVNVTGSPATIYYRIFAFQPSDSTDNVSNTASSADSYTLNTDYNYTKLFSSGIINSPGSSTTTSVSHNLGYYPQVMAWWQDGSGTLIPIDYVQILSTGLSSGVAVKVNTSTIDFSTNSFSSVNKIHYRIYIDETS